MVFPKMRWMGSGVFIHKQHADDISSFLYQRFEKATPIEGVGKIASLL